MAGVLSVASHTRVFEHVALAYNIALRDLAVLYKRSSASLLWLVLTPVAYLAIYWALFAGVLAVQWINPATGLPISYAVPLFAGLTVYLFFANVVTSSPRVFVSKSAHVRRSAFPLWVLWLGNVMRCSIQASAYVAVLLLLTLSQHVLSLVGLAWLVLAMANVLLFLSALSLLLATVGAFLGDTGDVSRLVLRVLFYTAPVTYPLSLVPDRFQVFVWLNPLTYMVEVVRNAVVFGTGPNAMVSIAFLLASLVLLLLAMWVYTRAKGAIADVV